MRKSTTTMFLLLCTIFASGLTSDAKEGSDRIIRINNASTEQIKLTYLRNRNAKVSVRILDASGNEVFNEIIRSRNSFEKTYNISKLGKGRYHFEVSDDRGMFSKAFIYDTERKIATASVEQTKDSKYRVCVKGVGIKPVYVSIQDQMGKLIHTDYIDEDHSFAKTYDLSKLDLPGVQFEIYHDFKRINRSEF